MDRIKTSEKLMQTVKEKKTGWRRRLLAAKTLRGANVTFDEIRGRIMDPKDLELTFLAITAIPDAEAPAAAEFLRRALRHPIALIREAAAGRVAEAVKCGTELPLLVELLEDDDLHVRIKAIWGLGRAEDKKAVKPLANILRDPDEPWPLKYMAVEALGNMGAFEAGEEITALLKSGGYCLRLIAAKTLGELRYFPAAEALVNLLAVEDKKMWNAELKGAAVKSLRGLTCAEWKGEEEDWLDWWKKQRTHILAEGLIEWGKKSKRRSL